MLVVTITQYASMPGRYKVTNGKMGKRPAGRDASGPGEAAAVALDMAGATRDPYVIVGPESVLNFIPKELRRRDTRADA